MGGGASIGVFSWNSVVSLESAKVQSSVGGAGGKGGDGGKRGQGVDGGSGGLGVGTIMTGGRGGLGGVGGDGGSGSGGTGGPSYALVFAGMKPKLDVSETKLTAVDGGVAGLGGEIASVQAPPGSAGAAAAELEVK
jgi:hypothetical protein